MCKARSKVTHTKQQKYFHHLKGRGNNKDLHLSVTITDIYVLMFQAFI